MVYTGMHVINIIKYILSSISRTKLIRKEIKKLNLIMYKNGSKMYPIAPIITLQEHILAQQG